MNIREQKPLIMKDILMANKVYYRTFHVTEAEMRDYECHNKIMDMIARLPDTEVKHFIIGFRNNLNSLIEKNNLSIDLND